MHNLISLTLSFNHITGTGLSSLVDALKYHHNFTTLDLSGNSISMNSINGVELLTKLTNLRHLKLSNCSIDDNDVEALVGALEININLKSLNLSHNPFIRSADGLEHLARLRNIHRLDISGWSLHYEEYRKKRKVNVDPEYSEHNKHIQPIYKKSDVEQSKIRGRSLSHLLKHLTQLRHLSLCTKTDAPIYWSEELASAISNLPKLQLLNAPCLVTDEELRSMWLTFNK